MLDSGLEIRVPNDQYVVPFVQIDGTGAREYNTSEMEVLISAVGDQPATLGRYFLTAAYLMVNQDSNSFTLWQANPTADSQLVPVGAATDAQDCNNTTVPGTPPAATASAHPASHVSAGVIAGPIVGGLSVIAAIALFLFWRRRKRAVRNSKRPPSQHLFKQELHGESSATKHPPSYVTDVSGSGDVARGELHQTPMLQKQTGSWSGPIYEMSVGTPPPVPSKDRGSRRLD